VTRPFRLRAPRISENSIEDGCKALLATRGWLAIRNPVGRFQSANGRWHTYGERGFPDYTCLHYSYPGFLLETKAPDGMLSREQLRKFEELNHRRIHVVEASDLAEFHRWLKTFEDRWQ
jgi:hypothetical protein